MNKSKLLKRIIALGVLLLMVACIILVLLRNKIGVPIMRLETVKSLEVSNRDEFIVNLNLSDMGEALYPAASVIVEFDRNKLEFTGAKMGNVMVYENYNPERDGEKEDINMVIPTWSCNTELSNQTGEIRAMYMDMTGGSNAYAKAGFDAKSHNTVLRLGFRLKDSVSVGEKLKLQISDAVFAASGGDENGTSLSTSDTLKTLRIANAEIIIR